VPFSLLILVLFAVALDSEPLLLRAAAGLVWLAMLFSTMLIVQRSFEIETQDAALEVMLTGAVDPAHVYIGKSLAAFVQLLLLASLLTSFAVVLYGVAVAPAQLVLLVTTLSLASLGLAVVGTLYGAVVARLSSKESLLPLLSLPVLAPLLIGASRATEAAFGSQTIEPSTGWAWVGLLAVYAVAFGAAGMVAFGVFTDAEA
jgi:heme exporter protein B